MLETINSMTLIRLRAFILSSSTPQKRFPSITPKKTYLRHNYHGRCLDRDVFIFRVFLKFIFKIRRRKSKITTIYQKTTIENLMRQTEEGTQTSRDDAGRN